jgi:MFS family permease
MTSSRDDRRLARLKSIPKSIWALGFVSLFTDVSSELVHSLLPVFMATTLGASMLSVGMVEGIAEATALITKMFSGALSDYLGHRKLLTLIGYGIAALTKPLFPMADSVSTVFAARFIDRIGKGVRGAPRDALIGDIAPAEIRGACFGLRQSLDTVGAFIGPLLAMLAMALFMDNIRAALWIAVIPGLISVVILAIGVKEPERHQSEDKKPTFRVRDIRQVGKAYWRLVAVASLLTLARFSEAFLILKAQAVGLPIALVPAVLVLMNFVYFLAAYPAGKWSDEGKGRSSTVLIGIGFLIAADIVLALAGNLWLLALGVSLWGLHMGFTQGLLATMVTDTTPPQLRGTAYGIFNLASGITMLLASVIAGAVWDSFGATATFLAGAVFAAIASAGLFFWKEISVSADLATDGSPHFR